MFIVFRKPSEKDGSKMDWLKSKGHQDNLEYCYTLELISTPKISKSDYNKILVDNIRYNNKCRKTLTPNTLLRVT